MVAVLSEIYVVLGPGDCRYRFPLRLTRQLHARRHRGSKRIRLEHQAGAPGAVAPHPHLPAALGGPRLVLRQTRVQTRVRLLDVLYCQQLAYANNQIQLLVVSTKYEVLNI